MRALPASAHARLESARSRHATAKPERTSRGDSAGGIRTHDLELMRLARTAAPLPRESDRQESNLRSPVPETGGVAGSPTARRRTSTPGGTRTRSFRVEGPASSPFRPRGRELRRQGSNLPLASNSRASYRLDHAGTRRKERESNPQGPKAHPFSRRGTAPVAVLPSGPGRRRTCNPPLKRRELCQLSYRAEVWPAGVEPAAPRVSGERSTG